MEMEKVEFRWPAVLTGLEAVGPDGLAAILLRSSKTVRRQQYEEPEVLPPPVPGLRPRIWRLVTVKEWLDSLEHGQVQLQQPLPAAAAEVENQPRRRRGRPRKSAAVVGGGV